MAVTPPRTPDGDRPYSGYEDLDLEDEPLTPGPTISKQDKPSSTISPSTSFASSKPYVSPVSQKEDPWRSSLPSSSSASRLSTSTTGVTSPPALERASTGLSRTSLGSNDAAVLGVAVVDFNHLVGSAR